jgi:phosphatidate cytidylyltransferase|tara:strand:- start:647 stop:1285 length:639 start_codon:yes stop_codon:yes gene_type:complete
LNFDFLIYAIYLSLLSFAISIFFNILELKKNKENLNFSNQILLENKKVFNLFFLRETSTIYYLFGTLSFYYLYQSPSEINWVLLPLFTVFAIDTSSYFIGSKFGKRKISFLEIISPNKTLIGFITAFITGSCVFYSLNYFFFNVFSNSISLFLSIIFPFFAVIGDLYSSAIKRNFGIKDYGNILPGHGGVLDRLDSVIISLVLIGLAKVFLS